MGRGWLEELDLQLLIGCAGSRLPVQAPRPVARAVLAHTDRAQWVFEQPLARLRDVAEGVARGQHEAVHRHDPGIDQQVVLLEDLQLAGREAEYVAGAQRGRSERVIAARATVHRVVPPYPFVPTNRQQ